MDGEIKLKDATEKEGVLSRDLRPAQQEIKELEGRQADS